MIIEKRWITVDPPREDFATEKWLPATVNWSAIGSVSPATAIKFANAIIAAAKKAKKMNKQI